MSIMGFPDSGIIPEPVSPNTNIDEHLLMLIRLHFAQYDYNEKIVLEQFQALIAAAKIEELKWCQDDGSGPPSPFEIEERIKRLEKS